MPAPRAAFRITAASSRPSAACTASPPPAQLPEEVAERLGETDFMEEFEEEPEFMSGRKKREKEKREKKEKRRRSKDIFDDDDEDNGIFASHDDFIEKESSDDDIEVMDLNDL